MISIIEFENIVSSTKVGREKLKECPNCGESVFNKFAITEVRRNCVSYECHKCGNIGDIWADEFREDVKA